MGAIFIINGILIYIYAFDHNPPHIHVKHGGNEFTINLGDRMIEGKAKSKHIKLINEFIDEHEAELYTLWEKAQRGEYIEKNSKIIMILTVTDVEYVKDYTLLCTFSDGAVKLVDLTPLLQYPAFKDLEDKALFVQFGLEGTIFWKNGADIAPEYLYSHGIAA